MNKTHQHQWKINSRIPVLDCLPPIYTLVCRCGASASEQDGIIYNVMDSVTEEQS